MKFLNDSIKKSKAICSSCTQRASRNYINAVIKQSSRNHSDYHTTALQELQMLVMVYQQEKKVSDHKENIVFDNIFKAYEFHKANLKEYDLEVYKDFKELLSNSTKQWAHRISIIKNFINKVVKYDENITLSS